MSNRHPWQLKKSKSWVPFWSYQLNNSTAKLLKNSFEVKNIEIWVPAFFKHNNSSVATVSHGSCCKLLLCRMIRLQKGLLTRGVRLENSRGHSPLLLALLDVFSSGNLKVHITLDYAHMG